MGWGNYYLKLFFLVPLVAADLCPEPTIPNGVVSGEKETNFFFGEVTCDLGYHLVGASKNIKCRHGVWSQKELPVCSVVRGCPTLPEIQNGRSVHVQRSRGSAYRFKCNRGFKRFGEARTHCIGDSWSHAYMPTCAKATCDVTGMLDIPYGEGRAMMGGAVYKYRCNTETQMEGSNTLVCDGEKWNGTLPDCNAGPTEPELEVIVSGQAVTKVNPGDWVLVTCQAKGGHPLPDIGLTLDGLPSGSKDFRNFRNSFTFTATEEDNGKRILCTALNKVGTSAASTVLHVHTPPTNAAISGPKTIHYDDEFTYECSVEGGIPAPEITWTVRDSLGKNKEVKGEMMGQGLSRMQLRTGAEERMMSINCLGENSQGIVSHSIHVNTHYLPKTVEINGSTTATPGEYAHFTCLTTESFPVPALRWRVEKSGDINEVSNIDGDVSTEALEDGGVLTFAKIDILIEKGITHTSVECSAELEGFEQRSSEQHILHVISIEEPIQALEDKENENLSAETEQYEYSDEEYDASVHHEEEIVEMVTLEKTPEHKRSKILWIPLQPVEEIEDYQDNFASNYNEKFEEVNKEQEFFRPSDIPEATMLKQEKNAKSSVIQGPMSVSMVYSSSSTVSIQSLLFAVALSLSVLYS